MEASRRLRPNTPTPSTDHGTGAGLDSTRKTDADAERTDRAGQKRIMIAPMVGKAIERLNFSQ